MSTLRTIAFSSFAALLVLAFPGLFAPAARALSLPRYMHAWPLLTSFVVSPTALTISSTDAASSPSATSTAIFIIGLGIGTNAWTVNVAAASSSLTNCPQVPLSALKVTCSSVGVTGPSPGSITEACASAFTLSTTPQILATGQDGNVTVVATHTITTSVSFADSWKFPATGASSCSVSLVYSVTRN